jgi:hypothetical protein
MCDRCARVRQSHCHRHEAIRPLKVFWLNNKVAASGDAAIRKPGLGLSTVDTRVPAIATTLSPVSNIGGGRTSSQCHLDLDIRTTWKSNIARRTLSGSTSIVTTRPTVHRIESASSPWEMMPVHKRLTSIIGMCEIVCHQRAFEILIQ